MPGVITSKDIAGSLDAKDTVMGVIRKMIEVSNFNQLCTTVPVPNLEGTIPLQAIMEGYEDLGEWEGTEISGDTFESVKFNLKKDRVLVARSDEAKHRSTKGDPLVLQKDSAGTRLAAMLDKKVVRALQVNPQTDTASAKWDTVTNNPLKDLGLAVAALSPYTPDYAIMPWEVWAAFVANDYTAKYATGNPEKLAGVITNVPGLNLKLFVNSNVTAKSVIIGASGAPSCAIGNGPIEVREYDSPKGGRVYQIDVFRQALAPILKNESGKNMAAFQITGVIS